MAGSCTPRSARCRIRIGIFIDRSQSDPYATAMRGDDESSRIPMAVSRTMAPGLIEEHAMFANAGSLKGEEPPSTETAQLIEKASRVLLLILCVSPIALFPVAL